MKEHHGRWIAYCGAIPFPDGWSASRRAYGIARTLVGAGYDVVFISTASQRDEPLRIVCDENGEGVLSCVGFDERPPQSSSNLIKAMFSLFMGGKRMVQYLDSQPTKPSHVIIYQGYLPHMVRLISWCRRNAVPIISDVVDWYDARHLPGGVTGLHNINAKLALRFAYAKCNGVIAISSYLENYYKGKGIATIRIPTTLDVRSMGHYFSGSNSRYPVSLIYAGSTQLGKDLLGNIIRGIQLVDPCGKYFKLTLLGPSRDEVSSLLSGEVPSFIDFKGVVPQIDVAGLIGQADFSVLLRLPIRYAHAGFPTKFAESLASCTPVIANITSDMGKYFVDRVEGIICQDCSSESFADSLRRILALSEDDRKFMRHAAREQAEASFDFRMHIDSLRTFIEQLRK